MRYIWEVVQNANTINQEITFESAQSFVNCFEINKISKSVNQENGLIVQVNLYSRFGDIFCELMDYRRDLFQSVYSSEEKETRIKEINFFIDLSLNYLGNLDLIKGINHKYCREINVLNDIYNGVYGDRAKNNITYFSKEHKFLISSYVIRVCETGNMLKIFINILNEVFSKNILYRSKEQESMFYLYINEVNISKNVKKLELLKELFWHIGYSLIVYWKKHFGIIDVEKSMTIGELVIF